MAEEPRDYEALMALYQAEKRRREAAEQNALEEKRGREAAEQKLRPTNLPEFLDACHIHLHASLIVQKNPTMSTQGNPDNAKNKLRPERLERWEDFAKHQMAIWDDIMASDFASKRQFAPLSALEQSGKDLRQQKIGSEIDLHIFQRDTVDKRVSSIIESMYYNKELREKFNLLGTVNFENHANMLSPESQLEEGMEQLTVHQKGKQAKEKQPSGSTDTAGSSHPRADQFCHRTAAFIVEYKAPHKLQLTHINNGLDEIELEDIVQDVVQRKVDDKDDVRRLVAAVITQAFSYMVNLGVEHGCVCTGEAYIFLRVGEDPRTVYYYLSVPEGDVTDTTGWTAGLEGPNRLHLTAVGQMPARPSTPSCGQAEKRHQSSDEESGPDPDTPSRQQSLSQPLSRTQKTTRGSSSGRGHHGERYHQIDRPTFLALMRRQLADDLDTDCDPVGRPGAIGVLFRVRLRSHGYVVAAKGTPAWFIQRLRWEASIYERLRPIQGIYVPVHLGNIDLETRYHYEGICELVHMMFLSFGGNLIGQHLTAENKTLVSEQVKRSADAIHGLRVLHKDLMPRNILWNEETKHVMVIDFERAEVEPISAKRTWKTPTGNSVKQGQTGPSACTKEIRRAMTELNALTIVIRL
ncbi:kinase-like domain [Pyrenophora seminiperda CCB06]|uniref:Kinase-like domain n=1 Tax=Pyrenophora seminiperda CCB06 TaxID=1302712 RepID=A0A3M7M834_9PLEO|nr:kinase-like domain [Pyrenophora seminiperda CCB06]